MSRPGVLSSILLTGWLLTAIPLTASDLAAPFEAIGEIKGEIGDTAHQLVILHDHDSQTSYADRRTVMGSYLSINMVALRIENGAPAASPVVQITLMGQDGGMDLLSAEVFDEAGYDAPLVMGPDGGAGRLSAYTLDGDALSGTIEGSFLRLSGYTSDPHVADGAEPVPAMLHFSATLPPLD